MLTVEPLQSGLSLAHTDSPIPNSPYSESIKYSYQRLSEETAFSFITPVYDLSLPTRTEKLHSGNSQQSVVGTLKFHCRGHRFVPGSRSPFTSRNQLKKKSSKGRSCMSFAHLIESQEFTGTQQVNTPKQKERGQWVVHYKSNPVPFQRQYSYMTCPHYFFPPTHTTLGQTPTGTSWMVSTPPIFLVYYCYIQSLSTFSLWKPLVASPLYFYIILFFRSITISPNLSSQVHLSFRNLNTITVRLTSLRK